jgi:Uma2 family endonuclease
MEVLDEPQFVRHRLNVDDYHRMAETGVLAADARVELIDGEVIDMAPMGTRHHSTILRLSQRLQFAVGAGALVATQLPLRLDPHNEPEPDLALLRPRADFYANALPCGADALLVIEVSDTTLAYDLRIKAPLYARHGVAALWVIDLPGGLLRRFSAAQGDVYSEVSLIDRPGLVALPGLPGCSLDCSGIF